MGRQCSLGGRHVKCVKNFGQETPKEETTWEYPWKDIKKIGREGVDWIHIVQEGVRVKHM